MLESLSDDNNFNGVIEDEGSCWLRYNLLDDYKVGTKTKKKIDPTMDDFINTGSRNLGCQRKVPLMYFKLRGIGKWPLTTCDMLLILKLNNIHRRNQRPYAVSY